MNCPAGLPLAPNRTSLILTGCTFRTLVVVVSTLVVLPPEFFHSTLPVKKPAPVAKGEVTLKVALTLAPGATTSAKAFAAPLPPEATELHCTLGPKTLSLTPVTGTPVVLVKVSVICCDDRGEKVVIRERAKRGKS